MPMLAHPQGAVRRLLAVFGCLAAALAMGTAVPGEDTGPFHPSAASVREGSTAPAAVFAGAQSCGRAGCHPQAAAEWASSAHRFSGMDNPWYRAVVAEARSAIGSMPTRWCAGCHTPALLLSGSADQPIVDLAAAPASHTGVSCLVCHSMAHVKNPTGQAAFELSLPPAASSVLRTRGARRALFDTLVRLFPQRHRRMFSPPTLREPRAAEACSTCHRAAADTPVNGHGWLAVFDDYSPWQASGYSAQSVAPSPEDGPRSCIDCHMPLVRSNDAGHRLGWARSHRFAAANTALPAWRGDRAQLQAVSEFLRARQVTVDLFALVHGAGPDLDFRAPLDRMPAGLLRGAPARLDVLVVNRGVGHVFPGGKQDLHECWLELRAVDDRDRLLFWSGQGGENSPVDREAHAFRLLWVDEQGEPVEHHRIWSARAQVNPQLIEAHGAQSVSYELTIPPEAGESVTLTARLNYRPRSWEFTRWAFSSLGLAVPPLPVVTMAEGSITLPVVDRLPVPAAPIPVVADAERWNSYGLAATAQGRYPAARQGFLRALELHPAFADAQVNLGRVELLSSDLPSARAALEAALRNDPGHARARFLLGKVEAEEAHYDRAIEHLRAVARRYPRDVEVRHELARSLFYNREFALALQEIQGALAINPEDSGANLLAVQAYSAMGDQAGARDQMTRFNRYRGDPRARDYVRQYFEKHPEGNLEMGWHRHRLPPSREFQDALPGRIQ